MGWEGRGRETDLEAREGKTVRDQLNQPKAGGVKMDVSVFQIQFSVLDATLAAWR